MHEDVKRIRFRLMGLAIIVVTLLQLLLIALNRVAIVENEWNRLENYAWNVKIKSIDYNVKDGKTIISIDKNKADMMQSEANGVSLGIVQRREKYNETLFDGFDAKDKQKILDGKFVRKTSLADDRHIFKLYQPLYSLKGDVIGIISARDQSGYYDELLGEIILNIFKVDFTAIFIFGIVFAVYVQKKRARIRKFQSSPNLCVKYFSQAQVVQGMRMHPCLSTITLEGAVKGAPSAHLEEVPLTASERVIHLTQLLVFVVPLPILLVQQPS